MKLFLYVTGIQEPGWYQQKKVTQATRPDARLMMPIFTKTYDAGTKVIDRSDFREFVTL